MLAWSLLSTTPEVRMSVVRFPGQEAAARPHSGEAMDRPIQRTQMTGRTMITIAAAAVLLLLSALALL
jgi:hypothetical protein